MMINVVTKSAQDKVKIFDNLKGNKAFWIIIAIIVLIIAVLPSYYFYSQYKKTQLLLRNPTASSSAQAQAVVNEVGKLMVLPTSEQPTIATVSDVTKLADQPFFANAKNGDKVLIYTQSKKAILFRESIDKIIEVAPVNLGAGGSTPQAPTASTTPAVVQPVTVTIYNGTTTSGLAGTAQSKISASLANTNVTETQDAKSSYQKTIVVDLSGNQGQVATQIANLLGGTVATAVPDGEAKSSSDILVILGSDFTK